jgi:hypothetical protein
MFVLLFIKKVGWNINKLIKTQPPLSLFLHPLKLLEAPSGLGIRVVIGKT